MAAPSPSASLRPHAASLEEMLDTYALQKLAWTYCHAVDRQDFALLRSLYHDDAIDDHGAMFCGSPDEYVAWLPSILSRWDATAHLISNMVFVIDGDSAEGELATKAYHRTKDGEREIIAHGRYLDQYKKRDGIWRFWRRSLVLDWMERRTIKPEEKTEEGDGVALGRPSAEDPCYRRLPMFAAQRSDGSAG